MSEGNRSSGAIPAPLAENPSGPGRTDAASAVRRAALEGLDLGLSTVIVHAVGEPHFTKDAAGEWVQLTDRKTGLPATYGAKIPCGRWKGRQETPATREELEQHLAHRKYGADRGVAVVCGLGGVELFEFDDLDAWGRFRPLAERDAVVGPILGRVMDGYFELSPRGAPHLLYRCNDLSNGGPLARRPEIVAGEDGVRKFKVLIETRGPGQIAVIAPSPGTCHKSGRPYVLHRGGLSIMATLTPDERLALHTLARTFDEVGDDEQAEPPPARPSPRPAAGIGGERPGDHFNRTCTPDIWREMLAAWRWEYIGPVGGRPHCWVHPTATSSLSAHLTPRNTLLVFSTSTPLRAWDPTSRKPTHSAFAVYASISHRGNLGEAAKELHRIGYGSRRQLIGGRR